VQEDFTRAWRAATKIRGKGRPPLGAVPHRDQSVPRPAQGQRAAERRPMDLGARARRAAGEEPEMEGRQGWIEPLPETWRRRAGPGGSRRGEARPSAWLRGGLQKMPARQSGRAASCARCSVGGVGGGRAPRFVGGGGGDRIGEQARGNERARRGQEQRELGRRVPTPQRRRPRLARPLRRRVRALRPRRVDGPAREDDSQSMPPYAMWLRGRDEVLAWWFGQGYGCQGSRVIPDHQRQRLAHLRPDKPSPDGGHDPWGDPRSSALKTAGSGRSRFSSDTPGLPDLRTASTASTLALRQPAEISSSSRTLSSDQPQLLAVQPPPTPPRQPRQPVDRACVGLSMARQVAIRP